MPVTFEDFKSGRVKPEFGNPEHIQAIRMYEDFQKRLEEDRNKKLYKVEFSISGRYSVQVRANNLQEAEELARDMGIDDVDYIDNVDVESVQEIKSK